MSHSDDLRSDIDNILKTSWDLRQGRTVPYSEDIVLDGGGVQLDGTVLYADLAQSSLLGSEFQKKTAAKVIKSFLRCCTKIITAHDGIVTSFDGDRVMGIYIGDSKNSNAAKSALKINYAVQEIIKPKIEASFRSMNETSYKIGHAVGIDTSNMLSVRAGQRGSNDLIWIGRSPNFAAKLSEIREPNYASYISEDVYKRLDDSAKIASKQNKNMWEQCSFGWLGETWTIYRSNWRWEP